MNSKIETFYFLCSPSIGIVDNWLPVIKELKDRRNDFKFIIVVPKAGTVEQFTPINPIVKISNSYFDEIIFKTHAGNWLRKKSINFAFEYNSNRTPYLISSRVDNWIKKVPLISKLVALSKSKISNKEKTEFKKDIFEGFNCSNKDYLLYDVQEHFKNYNFNILQKFKNSKSFSLNHGIHISTNSTRQTSILSQSFRSLTVYIFSDQERPYYNKTFSLKEEQLINFGIARHNKDWIEQVSRNCQVESNWEDFVFIISRPASDYLPTDRKEKYLRDIKKFLIEERNFKVIVKRHPKEKDEGLFEKVFGQNNKGKTWDESSAHPFNLGQRCKFAITFFSGVSLDMTYLNKPVIEYLNLDGLSRYDTAEALRDKNNHVVFSYRHFNLVLGASTTEQLHEQITKVLYHAYVTQRTLKEKYDFYFQGSTMSIKRIVDDILTKTEE